MIENNTITSCNIGIDVYNYNTGSLYSAIRATPTIENNDIYNNTEYNLFLGYPERSGYNTMDYVVGNIDASNNWWGTTDTQLINQTIRDIKDQSNIGTATFTPFLTAPNPQATPNWGALIPTVTQIPTSAFLGATNGSDGTVNLTVNGNLTLVLDTMANVTTRQSNATTNITFSVEENQPMTGFANVTIPKSAVPYGTKPTIYMDNQEVKNQGFTQDADSYYVWGTTDFKSYYTGTLTITFSKASSFSTITQITIIIIVVIVIATLTVILAYLRKKQVNGQKQIETQVS